MDALHLKGIDELGHSALSEQLKANLVTFFNWGLLNVGGFGNINISSTAPFDGDRSRLLLSKDKNYIDGQVWEGFRQDWVWEYNLDYAIQPLPVTGVTVNSVFHPLDETGAFSHYVDYPLGRIVFNNAIALNSVVQAEYSYRYYHFTVSDAPWFREFLFNSYRIDGALSAGNRLNLIGGTRVQLPAVVIEPVPRRRLRPLMLGGGHWVEQDVLFHIFAQEPWERDKLVDILTYQKDKTILSFNKNKMLLEDAFPLDANGSLKPNAIMYPDLVLYENLGGYFWKKIYFKDATTQEVASQPPLYRAIVRITFEIDFNEF